MEENKELEEKKEIKDLELFNFIKATIITQYNKNKQKDWTNMAAEEIYHFIKEENK
jgi:hypothetical protein